MVPILAANGEGRARRIYLNQLLGHHQSKHYARKILLPILVLRGVRLSYRMLFVVSLTLRSRSNTILNFSCSCAWFPLIALGSRTNTQNNALQKNPFPFSQSKPSDQTPFFTSFS